MIYNLFTNFKINIVINISIFFFFSIYNNCIGMEEYENKNQQGIEIFKKLDKEICKDARNYVIFHLPFEDQCEWRLVSKEYRDLIDLILFGSAKIKSFSSENSEGTIGSNILEFLKTAENRIIIASDKCTNEEFLDDLLDIHSHREEPLEIKIVVGEDKNTKKLLSNQKYSQITWRSIPSASGKMHNKFIIVDDRIVITGSPNLTYAAYNYNIESFVAISHRFIAKLYNFYYQYIVSGKDKYDDTQDEYCRVAEMMDFFNKVPNNCIKICLAPILNIKTFIINELENLQLVNINMFLVSRATIQDNDIVDNLLKLASGGTHVTIKVDELQYRKQNYVQEALDPLVKLGQEIYTVSKNRERWPTKTKTINTQPQFHDKLVLIRQTDGGKKVFIGSAGFTEHVQDNVNLENMVLICIPGIYDELLTHFNSINETRLNVTKL